ncbi:MAG TPA: hypothetical protein VFV50_03115, partial [Bdellovibrionales bacterium]|nr:hypothetical protein [Bdellovibrionales bacterium]
QHMKKLAAFFAAIGFVTQMPAVSQASWGDRNWDRMASIADQIEDGYDILEDQADSFGGRMEELAERGENLSDMLDNYLNPTSFERYHQYKSKAHLEQLWGAVARNFLLIRAEMARLGITRAEFTQFQALFVQFDVYLRRAGGLSAFNCQAIQGDDSGDAKQGQVIVEEDDADQKKGEQGKVVADENEQKQGKVVVDEDGKKQDKVVVDEDEQKQGKVVVDEDEQKQGKVIVEDEDSMKQGEAIAELCR